MSDLINFFVPPGCLSAVESWCHVGEPALISLNKTSFYSNIPKIKNYNWLKLRVMFVVVVVAAASMLPDFFLLVLLVFFLP